jgi:hypothetical protein
MEWQFVFGRFVDRYSKGELCRVAQLKVTEMAHNGDGSRRSHSHRMG